MKAILSWCSGDPCDPCQVGNLEIVGIYGDDLESSGNNALCFARGGIISFPEFPITIEATIELQGIYRPFVGPIYSPSGSIAITGTSYNVDVLCPLPSTYLETSWNPTGSDQLLFKVTASSSTTSSATFDITSVQLLFHEAGSIIDVASKARWTGNVE